MFLIENSCPVSSLQFDLSIRNMQFFFATKAFKKNQKEQNCCLFGVVDAGYFVFFLIYFWGCGRFGLFCDNFLISDSVLEKGSIESWPSISADISL